MIRWTLFKIRQPKQFDYLPRHYDPDKEDLEKRIKNVKAELGMVDDDGNRIRREISFRQAAEQTWRPKSYKRSVHAANLRLIAILLGICALFYYIYTKLDIFVEKLA